MFCKDDRDEILYNKNKKLQDVGEIFMVELLFENEVNLPNIQKTSYILSKHTGKVDCYTYSKYMVGLSVLDYKVKLYDGQTHPQFMINCCRELTQKAKDKFLLSQMWDLEEDRYEVLEKSKYSILVLEVMGQGLDVKQRANMIMDMVEGLVDLFREAIGVHFPNSGRLFKTNQIRYHKIPRDDRYVYFATRPRMFKVDSTDEIIVDTIGMRALYLPDLQYKFTDIPLEKVRLHSYNTCKYILNEPKVIKDGDILDITTKNNSIVEKWTCTYTDSFIRPYRRVIEIKKQVKTKE